MVGCRHLDGGGLPPSDVIGDRVEGRSGHLGGLVATTVSGGAGAA